MRRAQPGSCGRPGFREDTGSFSPWMVELGAQAVPPLPWDTWKPSFQWFVGTLTSFQWLQEV